HALARHRVPPGGSRGKGPKPQVEPPGANDAGRGAGRQAPSGGRRNGWVVSGGRAPPPGAERRPAGGALGPSGELGRRETRDRRRSPKANDWGHPPPGSASCCR
ncbi:hypothetical protein THAOC_27404, partial [Thalassiosira oceanica]